jgi:RimJ/RimL family protein N-acetyltransferase
MKREGVLRQAAFKNGEFHDVIITSMLDTEYRQFIEIEKYWD